MTEFSLDTIHGNIAIAILSQSNGIYSCEVASTLADSTIDPQISYGQSSDHAISIALEQLAHAYRERAEEQQNWDSLAVERSPSVAVNSLIVYLSLKNEPESYNSIVDRSCVGSKQALPSPHLKL